MKELTVGDMIRVLEKLDPDLPIYDHYYDEDLQKEVWFSQSKPKPKKQTIHLKATRENGVVSLAWSDQSGEGKTIEKKKVVILYPPEKDAIEL